MKTFNWQDYHNDVIIGKKEPRVYTKEQREIKRKRRNLRRQKKTE